MAKSDIYQFYVEGEDDKKVIDVLKKDLRVIKSGKVDVFNVIQKSMTASRLRPLKNGTIVVLVYDTDVEGKNMLDDNIRIIQQQPNVKNVLYIPQVRNLEEELERASSVRNANDIIGSRSRSDFKRDLIKCTNLDRKLKECDFDITKFWSMISQNDFCKYGNDAAKIKVKQKK